MTDPDIADRQVRKTPAAAPARRGRPVTALQWLGIISITAFLSTELAAAGGACLWGLSGLLQLSTASVYALAAVIGSAVVFACGRVAILAFEAETAPENN